MKRSIVFLLLFLAIVSMSNAADFSAISPNGNTLYFKITDNINFYVSVTYPGSSMNWNGYNAPTGSLEIPSVVIYNNETYTVNTIGEYAFCGCSGITSVILPNTIVRIGDFSFNGCNISNITIPNSVCMIGRGAFSGSNIQSITGGNSLYYIGESAFDFQYNNSLQYAGWCSNLPDGIVYIGHVAYRYKGSIPSNTHITFENNTLGIAAKAFYQQNNIISVTFPTSLLSIGDAAFAECNSISSINIPYNVKLLGGCAFYHCTGLSSVFYNARCVEYIRSSVANTSEDFYDVFYRCTNLSSFVLGDSVRYIPSNFINGCSQEIAPITSINIPCNVDSIGRTPFWGCTMLDTIYYNAIDCKKLQFFLFSSDNESYCNVTKIIFGEGVQVIPDNLCRGMSSLQGTLNFPNSIQRIGQSAFNGCSSLSGQLSLPFNLDHIGNYAFKDCSGLIGDIIIPDNVHYIGRYAFDNCNNVSGLTIGINVDTMEQAFLNMSSLTSIQYNATNCLDGTSAFYGNHQISSCTFGINVQVIPDVLIYDLPNITSITLPEALIKIGQYNFGNSNISGPIILPSTLQNIGYGAFSNCGNPSQIVCNAINPPTISSINNLTDIFIGHTDIPLLVPCESIGTYQSAPGWNAFTSITGIEDCDTTTNNLNDYIMSTDIQIFSHNGQIVVDGTSDIVQIFDMTGRNVQNEELPAGVYIVKIGNHYTRKVVVIK